MIIKAKKESNFTQIENILLQDNNLSARAKGVLCYLLSLPENWTVRKYELHNNFKEGRDAIVTAFNELVNRGYIIEIDHITKDSNGKIFNNKEYIVFEISIFDENNQKKFLQLYGKSPYNPIKSSVHGLPENGKPVNGNSVSNKYYINNNTLFSQKKGSSTLEKKESSTSSKKKINFKDRLEKYLHHFNKTKFNKTNIKSRVSIKNKDILKHWNELTNGLTESQLDEISKEIVTSMESAFASQHHKENKYKWLTASFFLRTDKREYWLNQYISDNTNIKSKTKKTHNLNMSEMLYHTD